MEILNCNMEVQKNDIFLFISSKNNEKTLTNETSPSFKEAFEKIKSEINSKEEKIINDQNKKEKNEETKERETKIESKYVEYKEINNNRKDKNNRENTLSLLKKEKIIPKKIEEKESLKSEKIENISLDILNIIKILDSIKFKLEKIDHEKNLTNIENKNETSIKKQLNAIKSILEKIELNKINVNKLNEVLNTIKKEINELKIYSEKNINNPTENSNYKSLKNLKDIIKNIETILTKINKEDSLTIGLKPFVDKIERPISLEKKEMKNEDSKTETRKSINENKGELKVKEKKTEKKSFENESNKDQKENSSNLKEFRVHPEKEISKEIKTHSESKLDIKNHKEIFEKIIKQIGESAKGFITRDAAHLTINLKPESLGKVKIIINMKDDMINGKIIVETETVKNIISEEIQKVKETLASNGINLDKLDVYSQNQESNKEAYQEYLIYKTSSFLRKNNLEDQHQTTDIWEKEKNYYLNSNIYIKA